MPRPSTRLDAAIRLRLDGLSWQEISDQLGYANRGSAMHCVYARVKDDAALTLGQLSLA